MSQELFPRRREDGSLSVSARFSFSNPGTLTAAKSAVLEWLSATSTWRGETRSNEAAEDLRVAPATVALADDLFEVVFEGRPGSLYWKDWLVALTVRLDAVPGLSFECFYDQVKGAPHPASVRSAKSSP